MKPLLIIFHSIGMKRRCRRTRLAGQRAKYVIQPTGFQRQSARCQSGRANGSAHIGQERAGLSAVSGKNMQCAFIAARHQFGTSMVYVLQQILRGGQLLMRQSQRHCAAIARARGQSAGRALGNNLPAIDNHCRAANRIDFFENMGGNNNRLIARHIGNGAPHLKFLIGVKPVCRLIHHQHIRVMDNGLRQTDAAAIAFRQCINRLVQHAVQFGHLNGARFSGARRRFIEAANLRDELQKGARRHVGPSRCAFWQIAEMALRRQHMVANIHAHNARRAAARAQKAGNHFHRRRFAGPIGPQKSPSPDRARR